MKIRELLRKILTKIAWSDLKDFILNRLRNLLFDFYHNRPSVEWFLSLLCEIEMQVRCLKRPGLRDKLATADVMNRKLNKSYAELTIPKNSLYCNQCSYWSYSKIAKFIFGHQCCGYCYYLNKGDFSFFRPTDLLWDKCKECGINYDIDEDIDNE